MGKKSKGGRPTELTPEVAEAICSTLRTIGTIEDAASRAGVSSTSLYRWMQRGRQERRGRYREFWESIRGARAVRRLTMEAEMRTHAKKNWQALAWFMERTEPKLYAQRVVFHVTEELNRAVSNLERAFADRPDILEEALGAIAEGDSSDEAGEASSEAAEAHSGDSEAVQPA